MTSLWVRTIRHHRTDRQVTVPCTRADAHAALQEACHELDLPEPIWLDKNEREWNEFGMTRFLPDAFFEASSPRKIFGKYVYIYSRRVNDPVPELGIFEDCNGFLSYKWSDRPLDGYRWGGDISFNGGEIIAGKDGNGEMTYRWGNNHGSVMQVNGQWYVFYHRQTGTEEYSRQAMLEPIDAAQGRDGAVYLGKIEYRDGEPVSSRPVEMTSQGAHVNGLDARKWISAGYACHLHGGKEAAYIAPVYEQDDNISAPVRNITPGLTAGFRYLQFGNNTPETVTVIMKAAAETQVSVRLDAHDGKEIARLAVPAGSGEVTAKLNCAVIGKHAVYFRFDPAEGAGAEFDRFAFD